MYLNSKVSNLTRKTGPGDTAVDQNVHLGGAGENKTRTFFLLEMLYLYKRLPDWM